MNKSGVAAKKNYIYEQIFVLQQREAAQILEDCVRDVLRYKIVYPKKGDGSEIPEI